MRGSLTLRLSAAFWLALVVTLLISVLITHQLNQYRAQTALDPDTLADAVTAAQYSGRDSGRGSLRELHRRLRHRGFRLFLVRDSRRLPPELERWRQRLLEAAPGTVKLPRGGFAVVAIVTTPDGQSLTAVALRRDDAGPMISPTLALSMHLLVSLLVITLVAGWMARRLTQPVRGIQGAVRQFAAGDLNARVPLAHQHGSDDLAALARDFDTMAARIQALVSDRDRLLHDVSHEIRSPLARMRIALELARSGRTDALDRCDEEIERIDALVEEILTFARLDPERVAHASRDFLQLESVSLTALVSDAIERHQLAAAGRSIALTLDAPQDLTINADLRLLDRALDNLLSNALRYASRQISIQVCADTRWIELAVEDDGPGLPPSAFDHLFEPFWRADAQDQAGYGLGLALVDRVARAHQGHATARSVTPQGLCVAIQLPTDLITH